MKCDWCGHEWVAVSPTSAANLECPNCGELTAVKRTWDDVFRSHVRRGADHGYAAHKAERSTSMVPEEIRICNECGEEWVDVGDEQCPFCGSWDTDIKEEPDEEEEIED